MYELVVIGASWGGFAALVRVLGALPVEFELPVAVAQHRLAGAGPDAFGRALAQQTAKPVREISDKDEIRAGHVYLAPPDYHVHVEPGRFVLSIDEAVAHSRPSIDVLFDSAADAYRERLIGVILTGANRDGAYGISRISRLGGLTIAQDPVTAERREMPAAAIATGAVERVEPLEGIRQALVDAVAQVRSAREPERPDPRSLEREGGALR